MTQIRTDLRNTRESARELRVEPTGAITQTNVQKALEQISGTLTIGTTPIVGGTSGGLLFNNAGLLGNFSTITGVEGGALTISPTAGTVNRGLGINQTGPTSGTVTGPNIFNLIDVTNGAGSATAGFDVYGNFNSNTYGARYTLSVGGASLAGAQIALSGNIRGTSTNTASDKIGVFGSAATNINDVAGGGYFGVVSDVYAGPSAVNLLTVGAEFSTDLQAGATITNRFGLSLVNIGTARGSSVDTAIHVSNSTLGSAAGSWSRFVEFGNYYGLTPMATTAKLFYYDHAATIADVFDFSTHAVTITGNIWSSPNLTITGSGIVKPTVPGDSAIQVRSGAANQFAAINVGRTASEAFMAVSGASNSFGLGEAAGDGIIEAGNNLFIATNFSSSLIRAMKITTTGQTQLGAVGTPNSGVTLTVSANVTQLTAPTVPAVVQYGAVDGSIGALYLDAFGTGNTNGYPAVIFRRANGTNAVKSAVQSGDIVAQFGGLGYGASSYGGLNGQIQFRATENWTDTAQGMDIRLITTPTGGLSVAEVVRIQNSGGVSIGTTTDPGAGALIAAASIKSAGATSGIGYGTGAGGTVTQATDKSTTVVLNKSCGAITMNNAALNAGVIVSFTLTNSAIAATDVLVLNHISGGTVGSYGLNAQCAGGSATINVRNNTAGNLSEAIVIQFAVIKGVNA